MLELCRSLHPQVTSNHTGKRFLPRSLSKWLLLASCCSVCWANSYPLVADITKYKGKEEWPRRRSVRQAGSWSLEVDLTDVGLALECKRAGHEQKVIGRHSSDTSLTLCFPFCVKCVSCTSSPCTLASGRSG